MGHSHSLLRYLSKIPEVWQLKNLFAKESFALNPPTPRSTHAPRMGFLHFCRPIESCKRAAESFSSAVPESGLKVFIACDPRFSILLVVGLDLAISTPISFKIGQPLCGMQMGWEPLANGSSKSGRQSIHYFPSAKLESGVLSGYYPADVHPKMEDIQRAHSLYDKFAKFSSTEFLTA